MVPRGVRSRGHAFLLSRPDRARCRRCTQVALTDQEVSSPSLSEQDVQARGHADAWAWSPGGRSPHPCHGGSRGHRGRRRGLLRHPHRTRSPSFLGVHCGARWPWHLGTSPASQVPSRRTSAIAALRLEGICPSSLLPASRGTRPLHTHHSERPTLPRALGLDRLACVPRTAGSCPASGGCHFRLARPHRDPCLRHLLLPLRPTCCCCC